MPDPHSRSSKHAYACAQESAELQVRVAAQTVNRDDIVRMTTERCGVQPWRSPCMVHSRCYGRVHAHACAPGAATAACHLLQGRPSCSAAAQARNAAGESDRSLAL